MRKKLNRLLASTCRHQVTIVVRSAGMERIVCESCGHISFAFDSAIPETKTAISESLETADV